MEFTRLDIILNVSPSNPPHSLNLLAKLLKDKVIINVIYHMHSSIKTMQNLDFKVPTFTSNKVDTPVINIRLIWKDGNINSIYSQIFL